MAIRNLTRKIKKAPVKKDSIVEQITRSPRKKPAKKQEVVSTTHTHLLLDTSGSMSYFSNNLYRLLVNQLQNLVDIQNENPDELMMCSVYGFSDRIYSIVSSTDVKTAFNYVNALNEAHLFKQWSGTNLYDSMKIVIEESNKVLYAHGEKTSHVFITLTDGQDTKYSLNSAPNFSSYDKSNRTFMILHPPGFGAAINQAFSKVRFLNIREWEVSKENIETTSRDLENSHRVFMRNKITRGVMGSSSYYTPVVSTSLVKTLDKVSSVFQVWKVQTREPIKSFVDSKLAKLRTKKDRAELGSIYAVGRGFYQLMKKETVQPNKQIAIMDSKGQIFDGSEARKALGVPEDKNFTIIPDPNSKWTIFIQSTSVNRILIPGTDFLYLKN